MKTLKKKKAFLEILNQRMKTYRVMIMMTMTMLRPLKGSARSNHKDCQQTLRKCKQKQLKKEHTELLVNPDPTNIRDKNAILVEAHLDDMWLRVE